VPLAEAGMLSGDMPLRLVFGGFEAEVEVAGAFLVTFVFLLATTAAGIEMTSIKIIITIAMSITQISA
jgi:hypothetical protein